MNRVNEFLHDCRHLGVMAGVFVRVSGLLQRVTGLRIYRIRCRTLGDFEKDLSAEGFTFRQLDIEDLERGATDPALGIDLDQARRAFERGDVAFGAYDGEILAGYNWRTEKEAPDFDDVWIQVRKPYRYGYAAFVHPSYRRRSLNAILSSFSDAYFRSRGFVYDIGYVDTRNRQALLTGSRKRMVPIGYAGYIRIAGRLFSFRTRAVRATGFRWVDRKPENLRS